nr:MAG TPA: zipper dimerization domain transcription factor-like protein [Caudoviricetes sp.]
MDNKLRELSKPVAWKFKNADGGDRVSLERKANIYGRHDFQPLYSQEYVSALEQKIADLEQAMRHIHGALLDITVPRVAIAKAAELSVEHAAMKEQSNG